MKINLSILAGILAATGLVAAPLVETTAVHTKPDANAPVITVLSAGTEAVTSTLTSAPAGWMAVEIAGTHEGYLHNKDFTKNNEARPGAALLKEPKPDAAVLGTIDAADKVDISGLAGRYTQVQVNKTLVGYIKTPVAAPVAAAPMAPAPTASAVPPAPGFKASPTRPTSNAAGRPAPGNSIGSAELPRMFQGRLTEAKKFIGKPLHQFQLVDSEGKPIAFLDISRLLLTEKVEKYIDRTVAVYGLPQRVGNDKVLVIVVESLQLK